MPHSSSPSLDSAHLWDAHVLGRRQDGGRAFTEELGDSDRKSWGLGEAACFLFDDGPPLVPTSPTNGTGTEIETGKYDTNSALSLPHGFDLLAESLREDRTMADGDASTPAPDDFAALLDSFSLFLDSADEEPGNFLSEGWEPAIPPFQEYTSRRACNELSPTAAPTPDNSLAALGPEDPLIPAVSARNNCSDSNGVSAERRSRSADAAGGGTSSLLDRLRDACRSSSSPPAPGPDRDGGVLATPRCPPSALPAQGTSQLQSCPAAPPLPLVPGLGCWAETERVKGLGGGGVGCADAIGGDGLPWKSSEVDLWCSVEAVCSPKGPGVSGEGQGEGEGSSRLAVAPGPGDLPMKCGSEKLSKVCHGLDPEQSAMEAEEDDPDENVRQKRLQRNRQSALQSRQRRKQYVQELEMRCRMLEGQVAHMRQIVAMTALENGALRDEVVRLRGGTVVFVEQKPLGASGGAAAVSAPAGTLAIRFAASPLATAGTSTAKHVRPTSVSSPPGSPSQDSPCTSPSSTSSYVEIVSEEARPPGSWKGSVTSMARTGRVPCNELELKPMKEQQQPQQQIVDAVPVGAEPAALKSDSLQMGSLLTQPQKQPQISSCSNSSSNLIVFSCNLLPTLLLFFLLTACQAASAVALHSLMFLCQCLLPWGPSLGHYPVSPSLLPSLLPYLVRARARAQRGVGAPKMWRSLQHHHLLQPRFFLQEGM